MSAESVNMECSGLRDTEHSLRLLQIVSKCDKKFSSIFDRPSIHADDDDCVWLLAESDQVLCAFTDAELSQRPF
jgi:hypothetical protein